MIFWIVASLLTFAAVLAMIWPIISVTDNAGDRGAYGLQVYRDQLSELERDHAQGRIGAEDLTAARIEIQRRMLAAAGEAETDVPLGKPTNARARRLVTTALIVFFVPAIVLAVYVGFGRPDLPDRPYADRAAERLQAERAQAHSGGQPGADGADGQRESIAEMVAGLEQRLENDPRDREGWVLLGRSFMMMRDYPKAAEAMRQAVALSQGDPRTLAAYGEALTMAAEGSVTPDAEAAFKQALEAMPGEPRARFYLGLAEQQRGDVDAALKRWISLEADTPADAGWEGMLKQQIDNAAEQAGVDVAALRLAERAKRPPRPAAPVQNPAGAGTAPRGPNQDQVAAAQRMSPVERQNMIKNMVENLAARLKETPGDIDGWLRLGRSYGVLQRARESLEAYAKAAELAPERIDVQMTYARALFPRGTPEADMPDAFKGVIRHVLELDPALPEAMFYGGMVAAVDGDSAGARELWTRLLARMGPDAPARPILEQRLKALNDG